MKGPIAYMARNHVAANILVFIFLVGGFFVSRSIKQEVFPEFQLDLIRISVVYPGATPQEVEEAIVLPIELAASGVDNVKRIQATASEGVGTVVLEVLEGADADQVLQDARSEVDRIQTFPEEAERPVISKVTNRREVVSLMVHGNVSEKTLAELTDRVRDDLIAREGVTVVETAARRPYEISIEIPESNLRKYNLSLPQVANLVRMSSLDLAGGTIKSEGGEILVRTKEKRYTGSDFDSVVVLARDTGERVFLGDIGHVIDGFSEERLLARFDGEPANMVRVFRVGDQKPTEVADAVREYIEETNARLPDTVHLSIWEDDSRTLASRRNLLLKNGMLGLILVLVILSLFLELRLAFWVAFGILVAFVGSFLLLPAFEVSINMLSLFAYLIILGVVVDDAIVVGENIYFHARELGKPFVRAAIEGTREVAGAVTFAALTTFAAFGPLLFVTGFVSNFLGVIPIIVISVLALSLLESFFILPSHLSSGLVTSQARIWDVIEEQRRKFDKLIDWLINHSYAGTLRWARENRYTSIAGAVAILLVTVGLVAGGLVKFTFLPEIEADQVTVNLTMPPGTPFAETRRIARHIEETGLTVVEESDSSRTGGGSNLKHIFTLVGQQVTGGGHSGTQTAVQSNVAQIRLLLDDPEVRTVSTADLARIWRDRVGEVPGAEQLSFTSDLVAGDADIQIQVAHQDYGTLLEAVERLKEAMAQYAGAEEISDSHTEGKRELRLRLRPEARTLGITESDLATQVRAAFYGAEAKRIQRGQHEVKVMVRLPEDERRTLATIDHLRIRTPSGMEVPFDRAAHVDEGRGYSQINRADRRRVVNVSSKVDPRAGNAEEILADLQENAMHRLRADYPGLSFDLEGRSRDQRESMTSMMQAFGFGLLLIFAILAVAFRSIVQPVIVMSAIPFGIVGAIGGHLLLGFKLSMMSLFGIVALAGVVVNASLVMIVFINQERAEGRPLREAIQEVGLRRFRPIVMTALTTFFGLTPMILETSVQARFLVPMAVALGFGVLFATFITLVLVPVLYQIMEDVRGLLTGRSYDELDEKVREQHGELEDAGASR